MSNPAFSVSHDLNQAIKPYHRLFMSERRINFAMALGLTRTAQDVKARLEGEIKSVFDRPTPMTQKSLFLQPATKDRLEALVKIKDQFTHGFTLAKTLEPQISGGGRGMKGFEKALRQFGILPDGLYAAPGAAARIDQYGNMSRGQIVQIMSQLRIQRTAGFDSALSSDKKKAARSIKRQGGRYFAAEIGGTPGIWQRETGSRNVKPVVIFVRAPNYKTRLNFHAVAEAETRKRIGPHMHSIVEREFATAYSRSRR